MTYDLISFQFMSYIIYQTEISFEKGVTKDSLLILMYNEIHRDNSFIHFFVLPRNSFVV